jgi:hypothetical protein
MFFRNFRLVILILFDVNIADIHNDIKQNHIIVQQYFSVERKKIE